MCGLEQIMKKRVPDWYFSPHIMYERRLFSSFDLLTVPLGSSCPRLYLSCFPCLRVRSFFQAASLQNLRFVEAKCLFCVVRFMCSVIFSFRKYVRLRSEVV